MKKLSVELFLRSFYLKTSKTINNSSFFFSTVKKVKDSKQPQIKKDEIIVDSKIIKSPTDLKRQ